MAAATTRIQAAKPKQQPVASPKSRQEAPPRRTVRLMEWPFSDKERAALMDAWDSRMVTQGARVRRFEQEMVRRYAAPRGYECAMVNSGSSALLLAASLLRQRLQRSNDHRNEVIFPAVCWSTTVAPFIQQGFRPVFVDVGPDYCIDPKLADRAVTDRTAAIVAVHLLGNPCDMGHLNRISSRYGLEIINDACEAIGASWSGGRIGTVGFATAFSYYYSHHVSTVEGGALLYPAEYPEVKAWREHGWIREYPESLKAEVLGNHKELDPRWVFDKLGWNLRSTDLNAAIGLVQLDAVETGKKARQRVADTLDARLQHAAFEPRTKLALADPNPFSYPVKVRTDAGFERKDLVAWLEAAGIETRPVMTGNITRHPWYQRHPGAYNVSGGNLPVADLVHERSFLIPCHPQLAAADIDHIVAAFDSFLKMKTGRGLK